MTPSAKRPDKSQLIQDVITRLTAELVALEAATAAAREAATHDESRAEDPHDTRGLEASYLASAQAGRVSDLRQRISLFRALTIRPWGAKEPIAAGALLELEHDGKRGYYFLLPIGGAPSLPWDGGSVHVITPQSPLGDALVGRRVGDTIEIEAQGGTREYEIKYCG